jgi:iron(III) transport system ATP-binding protein
MIFVNELSKVFVGSDSEHTAVNNVSFEVPRGSVYVLLGPSGCGKTTLLRCLAGIETPDSGEIEIDGGPVFSSTRGIAVPAHRRGVGFVFQSYAIWPHMTVFDNVAYPLRFGRARRVRGVELEQRVKAALDLVGLAALSDRPATKLSGGQQQRVALARAVVHEPSVLLMDEPLSNLDAQLRQQTRKQLAELLGRLGTTTVYVTHDQVEAMALADVVAVMQNGVIQQSAPPRELYERPTNRFVADFMGDMNWLEATVRGADGAYTIVDTPLGQLSCASDVSWPADSTVSVGVRPFAIKLNDTASQNGRPNIIEGNLAAATFLGDATALTVRVGETIVEVLTTEPRAQEEPKVSLYLPPDACLIYEK